MLTPYFLLLFSVRVLARAGKPSRRDAQESGIGEVLLGPACLGRLAVIEMGVGVRSGVHTAHTELFLAREFFSRENL